MKGLAPHTQRIFESVATLECIKPYILVGGTALSIQVCTRLSEDLDFMKWRTTKDESPEVDWYHIEQELGTIGKIQSRNLLDIDHVEFILEGVKLSFYSSPKYSPVKAPIPYLHNLRLADIISIGAMKMEVMMRRSNFRDYYDIYSILKTGIPIWEMITIAQEYSGHRLKTKNILAILTNGSRFKRDEHFCQLSPIYQETTEDIECYIKECLSQPRITTDAV